MTAFLTDASPFPTVKGAEMVADFGPGPPLSLKAENDRVLVFRAGKLVGYIRGDKWVMVAPEAP